MSHWPSKKGRQVFRALQSIGWKIKQTKGSSLIQLMNPSRPELGEYTWAFGDSEEIGPKMLARISKHTGLKPEDL